jgi:hypothetical protein
MQALKALVIVMGVLIVAGLAVVVVTIYNRMQARTSTAGPTAEGGELPAFDRATVPVPAGCRVAGLQSAGDRLLLQLAGVAGCEQILVVDLRSGRLLGRLDLVATP